jgi:uncharacterized membrane-anchored protein
VKFNARRAQLADLPGVLGTARVGERTSALLPRLRYGDVVVLDHVDLDSDIASALVNAKVAAVVNASPMISGRYANLGPEVLATAGVMLVDHIGPQGLAAIPDDALVRVHGGTVYVGEEPVAIGRELDIETIRAEMAQARSGLLVQLDTLTHNTSEFLRREQELLLNGRGLPEVRTQLSGRPVAVVAEPDHADLTAIRGFVREQDPAVIAVGPAADDLLGLSWVPDIVVVTAGVPTSIPSLDALRAATDVVVVSPRGGDPSEQEAVEQLGIMPLRVETSATSEDVALLLAERHDAALIVGVGLHARLEDFLDNQRAARASTFATRLKVGSKLIDAGAVDALYAARTRWAPVLLLVLSGVAALGAAIAVTPVGQEWAGHLPDLFEYLQGLF